jgi:[acyl-carrier-protein] S-malonyltransferase
MVTVLLFPGQGSQKVGMGAELCKAFPAAKAVFDEADEILGEPLSRTLFEGPKDTLTLTRNAQPAILVTSIAVLRALESLGPVPFQFAAGHSLGEWSALVAAGAIDFADAVRMVRLRGEAMQSAVPAGVGAMAAIIGLSAADVDSLCYEAATGRELCTAANYNGAGQIVIAGHAVAVERAVALAKQKGAKLVKLLEVSAPFHTPLMAPAAAAVAEALVSVPVRDPRVPVIANVDAEPSLTAERVREALVRQVGSPVRWEATMHRLVAEGVTAGFELGSGNVLSQLAKRVSPTLRVTPIGEPNEVRAYSQAQG